MDDTIIETTIPGLPRRRGKVRDIYDLGDRLLIVACDRISAFDVVLPGGIPGRGVILTRLSRFWFQRVRHLTPHHMIAVVERDPPAGLEDSAGQLRGRAMLCRKCQPVPLECVVRGYLAGSAWREYRQQGAVGGVGLPPGLRECDPLPEPVFTPATKEPHGHDRNLTFEQACQIAPPPVLHYLRDRSVEVYRLAAAAARERGVILADTKLEWGRLGEKYVLIDELVTPDSSRLWPAEDYAPGQAQRSLDKQYVRDYLQGLCDGGRWNRAAPAPRLPPEIVAGARDRYLEAYQRLTGEPLAGP